MEIKEKSEMKRRKSHGVEQSAPCVQEQEKTSPPYADYINWVANHAAVVNPIKIKDDEEADNQRGHMIKQMIKDMAPSDPIEAMLISQMASIHNISVRTFIAAGLEIGACSATGKYPLANLAAKLANVFTRQIEALALYRGKESTQRITVEQVKVEAGGQAIVGNIHGANIKKEGKSQK